MVVEIHHVNSHGTIFSIKVYLELLKASVKKKRKLKLSQKRKREKEKLFYIIANETRGRGDW